MKLQTLDMLARQINGREQTIQALRKQTVKACNDAVCEVLLQGKDLIEAKGKVKHGEWEGWLQTHCPNISDRTARRYMALASRQTQIEGLNEAASLRAALAICEMEGLDSGDGKEPKRWPAYLEALQRFDKFFGYFTKNPLDKWPEEGVEKLKAQLLPVVWRLWGDGGPPTPGKESI
jgi:hypothetical protein